MACHYFENVDDQQVTIIYQDLAATATISYIDMTISEQLTVRGARALAHGLNHVTQMKQLEIRGDVVEDLEHMVYDSVLNGSVLQPILEVAIQQCQELLLNFYLNDDVADKLSALLLLLPIDDDDQADHHHTLQTLRLNIGPYMTLAAAQRLAIGLRHAKLKCLDLIVEPRNSLNFMSTIYPAALNTVEKLVMFDSLDDAAAVELGNLLTGNTTLQSLDFRLMVNNLSVNAAAWLADGISQSCIVRLDVTGYITAGVEDILFEGVARSSTIQHLCVGKGCHGTSGLAQCLSRLHTLTTHNTVVVEDVPGLMAGLRNAPHLSSLVIGQYFKEEQDILTLCNVLPHLTLLTDLTMRCQLAFDEQQADDDAPFDLDSRHIQATSTEQLMVAVANHPSLVRLTLGCSDIGFTGLEMIGVHLPKIKLKELSLSLSDEYLPYDDDESVERAFERTYQALVAGVRSNWHLHVLSSYDDFFPLEVQEEIEFYLDLNKSGRYLIHDGESEKVLTGLWCHVLAKCGNNKAGLVYYHLQEQPTLLLSACIRHGKLNCRTHGPSICGTKRIPAGTKRCREEQMS